MNSIINVSTPTYSEPTVKLDFDDESAFKKWLEETASSHGTWVFKQKYPNSKNASLKGIQTLEKKPIETFQYRCDRYGHYEKESSQSSKKRKSKSKKIGCPAMITMTVMNDSSVSVVYDWEHPDHSPCDLEEVSRSRLPHDVKQWIIEKVNQNLDWKTIKNFLRLDEERLEEVNTIIKN
jgi:hypothetical protein